MSTNVLKLKEAIIEVLNELPEERIAEVLDFAVFLKTHRPEGGLPTRTLSTVPASQLTLLTGIVAWGGDAVEDTNH
jgi:hypothetical protein